MSSLAANNRSCAAPIKRVGICGAGAMGAIYAHHFSKAPQFETLLVASGDRASTLRDTPWIINGHAHSLSTSGGVAVLDPQQAEAAPPLDLLVVAVKHQHLELAIAALMMDSSLRSAQRGAEECWGGRQRRRRGRR